ncbi:hypothetical protein P22_2072 [Propionispora sp. 2/2-37]|uniref:HutD family protein n=1 Tax=Propionispora sp. 2/2-37 TaxID=1677858 RepID=UPI0006BB5548|nr:HutD family protein [Propionispora sp. 2/2-37]CUH95984.1 hypothetical protein P22_2072 [Propionispora sp. 2/2-37]
MHNHVRIVRCQDCKTTSWAGGKTTELLIHPPQASYRERNFSWRLSVATVEDEQSTFTSLPGIRRTLLLLKGNVLLAHEGYHQRSLQPLTQDTFWGDWKTTCYGKATDFNIMTRKPHEGKVAAISLGKQETHLLTYDETDSEAQVCTYVLYVWQGSLRITVDDQVNMLYEGDVCQIDIRSGQKPPAIILANQDDAPIECIVSTIYTKISDK